MNLNDSLSESRLISMINYIQPIPTIGVTNSHWPSSQPVWPDWAIFWTLGNFLKPLATINLPQSPPFLGNFCKGVKIIHFSSETILGNFYRHLAIFIWSHWSSHFKHTERRDVPTLVRSCRSNGTIYYKLDYFSPKRPKVEDTRIN